MTIKGMKTKVATVLAAGFVAGALVIAAPVKAEAQGFAVGVRIGGPRYAYAPAYAPYAYAPRYYGYPHERFVRHERWGWNRGYGGPRGYYGR